MTPEIQEIPIPIAKGLPYTEALNILKAIQKDLRQLIESMQSGISLGDLSVHELQAIHQNIQDWIRNREEKEKKSGLRRWISWPVHTLNRFQRRERK